MQQMLPSGNLLHSRSDSRQSQHLQ